MDDYPKEFAPIQNEKEYYKEPFQEWWARASHGFVGVPRNVARQWIHRHWGYSPYDWIKSNEVDFRLTSLSNDDISKIFIESDLTEPAEATERGYHLRKVRLGDLRCKLASIMERRNTWPSPIIILKNTGIFEQLSSFPTSLMLIEGHLRLAIARSLIADGLFNGPHRVWLMEPMQA